MRARIALFGFVATASTFAVAQHPWPMVMQDRYGSGHAVVGPSSYVKPWLYKKVLGCVIGNGPSIADDGTLFMSRWNDSSVHKMDWDANFISSFSAPNFVPSTACISGNNVFVTGQNYQGNQNIRAFSINRTTMSSVWGFLIGQAGDPVAGPDGNVVFGALEGTLFKMASLSGTPIWARSGLGSMSGPVAFSRDDLHLYVANGNNVSKIRYSDGQIIWSFNSGSTAAAPCVAPNGTILFGNATGTLFGLNPTTGLPIWSRAVFDKVRSQPSLSPDGLTAYFGCDDWFVYAINVATGARNWSYIALQAVWGAPTVGFDGRIYFGDRLAKFYILKPDGTLDFMADCQGGTCYGQTTIGVDGTAYFPTDSGMFVIRQQPTNLVASATQTLQGQNTSGALAEIVASDDNYIFLRSVRNNSRTAQLQQQITFGGTWQSLNAFSIKLESAGDHGLTQQVEAFNSANNRWDIVDSRTASATDTEIEIPITTNAGQYVNGSRQVIVRVTFFGPNFPTLLTRRARFDRCELVNVAPVFNLN